jgi:ribosomal-protein-alanine N-acetyltransferase
VNFNPNPATSFPIEGILGPCIHLRRFVMSDINQRYLGWLNDKEALRFSNQRFFLHSQQTSVAYLESFVGTSNLFLTIADRASEEMLGTMTAYTSLSHSTVDVGILLGERSRWGQGLGKEAWCLLVNWLLDHARFRKVTAGCAAGNLGMRRLMEAADMRHEATKREQEIIDGKPHDLVYYARFLDA